MGGANRKHHPHRGSMQFWPRKRAKRSYARVSSWKHSGELKLMGFPGYKAGMTHILIKDNNPKSKSDIVVPVTVVECPPLKVYSIRFYKNSEDGMKINGELFAKKYNKELSRKIKPSKKDGIIPEDFDDIKIVVYTQPRLTGLEKKKPEIMEVGIGGKDLNEKLDFAKKLFDSDIQVSDVLKEGNLVDIHSVTKGKGFQGAIKRFGVKRLQHKSEKKIRGIGNLGSWTPKKVQYTVAQPGKMGYHQRTEFNKLNIKMGVKPEEINPNGGFLHYGFIKNNYVLIKGSIPGNVKRLIVLADAIRTPAKFKPKLAEIKYLSLSSKQG
ncbi:MAG: 50S ribosomal protein L3 [Nanoarchaeota archaeon]|nr:50S ribosomal protein L3 [Nanoarchaeota archaeon]